MTVRGNSLLKLADRAGGIPLLWMLGLLPKRSRATAVARVGVLRTAAIGDTLLLSGILRDLRAAFSSVDLVLITGEENAEAGALASHGLARHLTIPIANPPGAVTALRRQRFDLLIDTGAWPRLDALLTALSGARFRVGFRTLGQYRHYAYDRTAEHSAAVHESDNYRALLRALDIRAESQPSLSRASLPRVAELPRKPFLVLHPWAGGFRGDLREWPRDRWVELARELRPLGATVVVTGAHTNVSQSEDLVRALNVAGESAQSVAGRFNLAQLGALLAESAGVVSTNTGVMHLAALLGVPTVGLNGPTASHRWGPIGPKAKSVPSTLPGCGFLNLGFEYDGQRTDCMRGIEVDAVARTFRQVAS